MTVVPWAVAAPRMRLGRSCVIIATFDDFFHSASVRLCFLGFDVANRWAANAIRYEGVTE